MPKLKRSVKNARSEFTIYDGPEPTQPGIYHAKIFSCALKESANGNNYFSIGVEFVDERNSKAQFRGYKDWAVITLTDHEANLAREANLYRAVTGKDDVNDIDIVFDAETNGNRKVTKIGGKSPIGVVVGAEMRKQLYNGENRLQVNGLIPVSVPRATEDSDPMDEEESVDREDELNGMRIGNLRKLATELGIKDVKVPKNELIESILEKEDEEEDEEEILRDSLKELNRKQLKTRLKNTGFKVLTKHTDADLIDAVVAAEVYGSDGQIPF